MRQDAERHSTEQCGRSLPQIRKLGHVLDQDINQALGENQTTQRSHLWLSGVNEAFRAAVLPLALPIQSQNETKIGSKTDLGPLIADAGDARQPIVTLPSESFFIDRTQDETKGAPVIPARPFLAEAAPIDPPTT